MRRIPTTLVLLPLLLPGLAAQAAEPGVLLRQDPVYSAALRNAANARLEFECRLAKLAGPEITLNLVLPQASKLRRDKDLPAKLVANEQEFDMRLDQLGTAPAHTVHRWTGIAANVLGTIRGFIKAIGAGGTLEVRDTETGAAESFPYTLEQGAAVTEVLRRCNPVAVQARQDASELSVLPALIALERNFYRKCREGMGDERSTEDACDERQEYVDRLNALGMCFGRKGETPQGMTWHRCGPTSFR